MVLEIILAAVLIAFGILSIYLSVEKDVNDKNLIIIILVGIAAIIGGGWIIFTRISLFVLLAKLAGLILAGVGLFLILGFPETSDYQRPGMSSLGVFIGLILLIIGAYLLFFYPI